jgi:hypothetical protein
MAKIKLTKTVVGAAKFGTKDYELRDTVVPGFLLKVTPAGRKIFIPVSHQRWQSPEARDWPVRRSHSRASSLYCSRCARRRPQRLITWMKKTPVTANRVLACLRKMFNMAEVWGFERTAQIHAATFQSILRAVKPG